MGKYDTEVDDAYNDIKDAGGTAKIVQPDTQGTYNPVTDTYSGSTTGASFSTYAVRFEYIEDQIDGNVIQKGDCEFYVPAKNSDFTPTQDHTLIFSNARWEIKNVDILDPDGSQEIMYTIQGRK